MRVKSPIHEGLENIRVCDPVKWEDGVESRTCNF